MSLLEIDSETGSIPVNEADLTAWDDMFRAGAFEEVFTSTNVFEVHDPSVEGGYRVVKFDCKDSSKVEADLSAATGHMVLKVLD